MTVIRLQQYYDRSLTINLLLNKASETLERVINNLLQCKRFPAETMLRDRYEIFM